MLDEAQTLPLRVFIMVPSCVPSCELETSGARLGVREVRQALSWEGVLGLAEMMNYPGVLAKDPEVLAKIKLARLIDGHAPGVTGRELNAYVAAGMRSDHESTQLAEALEKLRLGMTIMLRDLTLAQLVNPHTCGRCVWATDDKDATEIVAGHVDALIREAIATGIDPLTAIRMATLNPAHHFGLRELGSLGPGKAADLLLVRNLNRFEVSEVFVAGRLVVRAGRLVWRATPYPYPSYALRTIRLRKIDVTDLKISCRAKWVRARVIGIVPDQPITHSLIEKLESTEGELRSDVGKDLLKVAVFERHGKMGGRALGFVRGFGLKEGAIASSVAHDAHNLIVVGVSDVDMAIALNRLRELQGGFVVAADEKVVAEVPLRLAGLMSVQPVEKVCRQLERAKLAVRRLGCQLTSPFTQLSFLALPVIPELKITDRGLVDVKKFSIVSLLTE
jgi:adenine deaminase